MDDKKNQLKSIERQIFEYCQKFEKISEFREKNNIEIELENGYVLMEYSIKYGTVYVDKFDDDEMNLSIEKKTHLKYQFVEAIEKHYIELNEKENEDWNDGMRNIGRMFK